MNFLKELILAFDKYHLYKITIIALFLFIPLTAFSEDLNKCNSLIDSNGDNIPEKFPYGHTDFSYCNLIGIELNDIDIINANFEGADLSGAYLYGSNLQNANFDSAILYGTNLQSTNLLQPNLYFQKLLYGDLQTLVLHYVDQYF